MARKALTRKQILAGFGGSRRKSLAKSGNKRLYTPADKKRRSSSVKRKSSSSKRPVGVSVAVYAGVAAAAAAAGLTVAKYVKQVGGWSAFKTKVTSNASAVVGSVASWLGSSPTVLAGVVNPVTPAQQQQIFKTIPIQQAAVSPMVPALGEIKALPFFGDSPVPIDLPLQAAPAIIDQGSFASLGLTQEQTDAYGLGIDWNM